VLVSPVSDGSRYSAQDTAILITLFNHELTANPGESTAAKNKFNRQLGSEHGWLAATSRTAG
jgi:hypothetical protein